MKNTSNTSLRRQDLCVLAALILISLAVRIPGVFSRAIWYDEQGSDDRTGDMYRTIHRMRDLPAELDLLPE